MSRKLYGVLLIVAVTGLGIGSTVAAEPTLHEVYQAAESGRLSEAQAMMQEVLKAHPDSGKAHYVEAEILAKQGKLSRAAEELARAEKLAPGLPFAKPQAVENLRVLLRSSSAGATSHPLTGEASPDSASPWATMILGGLALIALVVFAVRLMASRAGHAGYSQASAAAAPSPAGFSPAYAGTATGFGYGTPPAPNPGLGSRLAGGLATGAALGAGLVAGEALAHHLLQDDAPVPPKPTAGALSSLTDSPFNDLGGDDFGVADNSSWDDGAGSDDWN